MIFGFITQPSNLQTKGLGFMGKEYCVIHDQFFLHVLCLLIACSHQSTWTGSFESRNHSVLDVNGRASGPKDEIKDHGKPSNFNLKLVVTWRVAMGNMAGQWDATAAWLAYSCTSYDWLTEDNIFLLTDVLPNYTQGKNSWAAGLRNVHVV